MGIVVIILALLSNIQRKHWVFKSAVNVNTQGILPHGVKELYKHVHFRGRSSTRPSSVRPRKTLNYESSVQKVIKSNLRTTSWKCVGLWLKFCLSHLTVHQMQRVAASGVFSHTTSWLINIHHFLSLSLARDSSFLLWSRQTKSLKGPLIIICHRFYRLHPSLSPTFESQFLLPVKFTCPAVWNWFVLSLWRRNPVCDSSLDSFCNSLHLNSLWFCYNAPLYFQKTPWTHLSATSVTKNLAVIMKMSAFMRVKLIKVFAELWIHSENSRRNSQNLFVHSPMPRKLTIPFPSRYRQHHQGQRLRGDDADRLWSDGHQDPPHQVLHHPASAQGQPHRHVLPALHDWQPGRASGGGADGVCLGSAAAPVLIVTPQRIHEDRQSRRLQLAVFDVIYSSQSSVFYHCNFDFELNSVSWNRTVADAVSTGRPHSSLGLLSWRRL